MITFEFKELNETDINLTLFTNFERYQNVKKCWRKEDGEWILKDIAFIEEWSSKEYEYLVKCLINTVKTGGVVFGVIHNDELAGFASIENDFFGIEKEYLQLSAIHISYEKRGMGIGKELFSILSKKAKDMGAQKLYISAHSSEETQAFYKAMSCVEAVEYNDRLIAEEPCDCQLEYCL